MKTPILLLAVLFTGFVQYAAAQSSPVQKIFPKGTITHANIAYANDTLPRHLLDIYLPPNTAKPLPLVVWIHGGAWLSNDKYADMGYMTNTVKGFIDSGYALASIDYRYSTQAAFPAQIQDCNRAIEYLYQHASEYHIDQNNIAVIGFSAGGHLASLLALSNNNQVKDFYPADTDIHFKIKLALDFYGPSDLIVLSGSPDPAVNNLDNPIAVLIGASPVERPDLAKRASPVTYIDKDDPPFLIVQGENDKSVPNTQSKMLHSWLDLNGVTNKLIIVPNAPHYGEMFDAEYIRKDLFGFLAKYLR